MNAIREVITSEFGPTIGEALEKIRAHHDERPAATLAEKVLGIAADAERDAEAARQFFPEWHSLQEAWREARAVEDVAKKALADGTGTELDVAMAAGAARRKLAARQENERHAGAASERARESKAVEAAVAAFVHTWLRQKNPALAMFDDEGNRIASGAEEPMPEIEFAEVKLPKGYPLTIASDYAARGEEFRSQILEIEAAPPRFDTMAARIPLLVEQAAATGRPGVTGVKRGALAIALPTLALATAASATNAVPRVADVRSLLAWLAPEQLEEAMLEDLRRQYEGVGLQMDPHEKPRRIKELRAKILDAERVECAAIWAAKAAGADLRFRAGTDPRAVLGVR